MPVSSVATWPPTNTKPPAFVASERGSVRVAALDSSKNSIAIFAPFPDERAHWSALSARLTLTHSYRQEKAYSLTYPRARLWLRRMMETMPNVDGNRRAAPTLANQKACAGASG